MDLHHSNDSSTPVVTDGTHRPSVSSSSESDSNSAFQPAMIDFDALINDIDTYETYSMIDPITLEPTQSNEAAVEIENNNQSVDQTVPNEELKTYKIKLVNIESLLDEKHTVENAKPSNGGDAIELSSESSSDQILSKYVRKRPSPKKRLTKSHRNAQFKRPSYAEVDSTESDSDASINVPKPKPIKSNEISHRIPIDTNPQNIYAVKVKLTKLPSNMEPLLKKYRLIEIRDRHQNIIASRKRTLCTEEVHKSIFPYCFKKKFSLSLTHSLVNCFSRYREQPKSYGILGS